MASYKDNLLKEVKEKGFHIGDNVYVKSSNFFPKPIQLKSERNCYGVITSIDGNIITILIDDSQDGFYRMGESYRTRTAYRENVFPNTLDIGVNPFDNKMAKLFHRCKTLSYDIDGIMMHLKLDVEYLRKYNFNKTEEVNGVKVKETNFDPYIFLEDGSKYYYQRDYIWDEEDERKLIDNIYKHNHCGSIVVRNNNWKKIEERTLAKTDIDDLYWRDIVDGKQRLTCIMRFLNDKFADSNGYYYSDLSKNAQHKFQSLQLFSYIELSEDVTDEDVLEVFLSINTTGRQINKEHLDNVRRIYDGTFNLSNK